MKQPRAQADLFDQPFATAEPANPLYCHQDFLEKLAAYRNQPIGKRAALLMQRLAVDERRQHYKGASGVNQGWRRSRLGGNGGYHFYAWWAPRTAAPLKAGNGFAGAPPGALFLRDIRHHDDHSPATAQSFEDHYLPVSIPELRGEEYGPAPWTPPQARFAGSRQRVRILKGYPGSGKTTALLHAADNCGAGHVLYVTYSRELAALARRHFDRYCSGRRTFHVATFEALVRQLLKCDVPVAAPAELRRIFRGDLAPFSRSLGPWSDRAAALYDELHAHLAGAALPVGVGRFAACSAPRASDANYRTRRLRYLGEGAVSAALDIAGRLERNDNRSLAERYFPELALAWQAGAALAARSGTRIPKEFLDFDCIAIDECQDLTPLEAFVLVELGAAAGRSRGPVSLFLAGDEAQTVRPTDFEWGWMNDLLHHRAGTPAEFQLATNLRSPRTIAQLVNRVWDLYSEIGKRDRPSGTGYAEIEDDATDQVFYCTAAPGAELDALLGNLASREGLAMVAFDAAAREVLPEAVRPAVLTPCEVKGLDFHTVCLLNAGRQIETILAARDDYRFAAADIESIRRRLAIDELRVALSRPADRLIWLDIAPTSNTVRTTLAFLNGDPLSQLVSPSIPAALLTALEEEQLDLEERIQRCQADARQYLEVRPEIAFSRARQAIALLGEERSHAAVQDESVRDAAHLTAAEICFCLAFRKVHLAPELGRPNLFGESSSAAYAAGRRGLAQVMADIGEVVRAPDSAARQEALLEAAESMVLHRGDLEPWLLTEIAAKASAWVDEMEAGIAARPVELARLLPPFYGVLRLPGAETRKTRLLDRAIRLLMKGRRHAEALEILEGLPERIPSLEAECLEGAGEFRRAAETYRSLGKLEKALACYRSVPDFDSAAALIREIGAHPAAEAYRWLEKMRAAVAERPPNFNRVMQAAEKKLLEQMLEEALGVARKKPAPRKTAPVKRAARAAKSGKRG